MKDSTIITIASIGGVAALAIAMGLMRSPAPDAPAPTAIQQPPAQPTTPPTTQQLWDNFANQTILYPDGTSHPFKEFLDKTSEQEKQKDAQIISQSDTIRTMQDRLTMLEHPTMGVPQIKVEEVSEYGPGERQTFAIKLVSAEEKITITNANFNGNHDALLADRCRHGPNMWIFQPSADKYPKTLNMGGILYLFKNSNVQPDTADYNNEVEYIDVTTDRGTYRYSKNQFSQWEGKVTN